MSQELLFFWSALLSTWTLTLLAVSVAFYSAAKDFEKEKHEFYSWVQAKHNQGTRERR
jgi:hypothetical protein